MSPPNCAFNGSSPLGNSGGPPAAPPTVVGEKDCVQTTIRSWVWAVAVAFPYHQSSS